MTANGRSGHSVDGLIRELVEARGVDEILPVAKRLAATAEAALYGDGGDAAPAFISFSELRASAPSEPSWLLDGYLARGAITLLAGKPKAGKSTFASALVEAIDSSAPWFLGRRL